MNEDNIFEDLERIYRLQEDSEKLHLKLTQEQLDLMAQLEETVIKEKVLPVLAQDIEPTLRKILRPLVLVVDYVPDGQISVSLTRRRVITDDKETKHYELKLHATDIGTEDREGAECGKCRKGRITLPNGEVIQETAVANTFVKFVKFAGAEKVRNLNLYSYRGNGIKLVMTKEEVDQYVPKNHVAGAKKLDETWYLHTITDTPTKIEQMNCINRELHIGAIIDIVEK